MQEPIDGGVAPLGDPPANEVPNVRTAAAGLRSYSVVDLGKGVTSNAPKINEAGAASGTLFTELGDRAVCWRGDKNLRLDLDVTTQVRAMAIGNDGTVGGWRLDPATGKHHAVAWTSYADGGYGNLHRISEVTSR